MVRHIHKLSMYLLVFLVLAIVSIGLYLMNYTGFFPRTFVAAVHVGAMTADEAKEVLREKIQYFQDDIAIITVNGERYFFHVKDLGISFDVDDTIETLYARQTENRPNSMMASAMISYADEYEQIYAEALRASIDTEKLRASVEATIPHVEHPENAGVVFFEGGELTVKPSKVGYTINYRALENDLKQHAAVLRVPRHVSYGLLEDAPLVETQEAEAVREKLDAVKDSVIRLMVERTGADAAEWSIPLNSEDFWSIEKRDGVYSAELDQQKIRQFLAVEVAPLVNSATENLTIVDMPVGEKQYPEVNGELRDGRTLLIDENVQKIVNAVQKNTFDVKLATRHESARIINESGENLGDLSLLATGRSNFEGSPNGRDFNIRRGLDEKFNNILLAPGESFSYNEYLGPVTYEAGWAGSLAIFGGKDLRKVPGGGLCQVSTTIYRALLNAGLSVQERSPHSLYVHYYVPHGEGLDAAIYPGVKDLVFTNDTADYIYLQAYHQGSDAFVKIYGTDDGRRVKLDGPFRSHEVPVELAKRSYSSREIIWFQTITWPDGEKEVREITSRYRTLPRT